MVYLSEVITFLVSFFFFKRRGPPRNLPSSPTRRSSDLSNPQPPNGPPSGIFFPNPGLTPSDVRTIANMQKVSPMIENGTAEAISNPRLHHALKPSMP